MTGVGVVGEGSVLATVNGGKVGRQGTSRNPEQGANADSRTFQPRHSREGGNPSQGKTPIHASSTCFRFGKGGLTKNSKFATVVDSRLRGNDGGEGG